MVIELNFPSLLLLSLQSREVNIALQIVVLNSQLLTFAVSDSITHISNAITNNRMKFMSGRIFLLYYNSTPQSKMTCMKTRASQITNTV